MHGKKGNIDFHLEEGKKCGDGCSQPLWSAQGTYSTTLFTSRAVEVVHKHPAQEPLFLYLAYQAVHAPREVPDSYADAYSGQIQDADRRKFAGMLSCMDEGIGNVTAALESTTLLQDTFIVFTTDSAIEYTLPFGQRVRLVLHLIIFCQSQMAGRCQRHQVATMLAPAIFH